MTKTPRETIQATIAELNECFIERDELIRLMLLAILSKEHIFMIGEPGVGKSYVARAISGIVSDTAYFEYLINENVEYKEIFGERLFDDEGNPNARSVLNAHFFFADELFKCGKNTGILNAFLQIMNERKYSDGFRNVSVPLITMIGASNEFPDDDTLEAFDDRLVLRYEVKPIQDRENLKRFVKGDFKKKPRFEHLFALREIDAALIDSEHIQIPDKILTAIDHLERSLQNDRVPLSNRKLGKAIRIMKVSALYNGREALDYSDLFLLRHIVWRDFFQRNRAWEKLSNELYGSRSRGEAALGAIREMLDRHLAALQTYEGLLAHRKEFTGAHREAEYKKNADALGAILKGWGRLEGLLSVAASLNQIASSYAFCQEIAAQVRENLFLAGPEPAVFTPQMIEKFESLHKEAFGLISAIARFTEENPDLHEYEAKQIHKRPLAKKPKPKKGESDGENSVD